MPPSVSRSTLAEAAAHMLTFMHTTVSRSLKGELATEGHSPHSPLADGFPYLFSFGQQLTGHDRTLLIILRLR